MFAARNAKFQIIPFCNTELKIGQLAKIRQSLDSRAGSTSRNGCARLNFANLRVRAVRAVGSVLSVCKILIHLSRDSTRDSNGARGGAFIFRIIGGDKQLYKAPSRAGDSNRKMKIKRSASS